MDINNSNRAKLVGNYAYLASRPLMKKLNALKNVNGSGLSIVGTMYYNGNGYVLSRNKFPTKSMVLFVNAKSPNKRYLNNSGRSNGGSNKKMFSNSVQSYLDKMLTVTA